MLRIKQQLGDLSGKTTLAHELIQNAGDEKTIRIGSGTRIREVVSALGMETINPAPTTGSQLPRLQEFLITVAVEKR